MAIRVRSAAAFGLALVLVGCSVGDYEDKMLKAQNRVASFEKGNRLLEGPISEPTRVENGSPYKIINLFIRPPKGISLTPSSEPRVGLFYDYLPVRQGAAGPFALFEIASAPKDDKDFEKSVLAAFSASGQAKGRARPVTPVGRQPLSYATYEFEDTSYAYSVNFLKGTTHQIAIVYWIIRASKGQAANETIEASLASCGVDGDAHPLRTHQASPLTVPRTNDKVTR